MIFIHFSVNSTNVCFFRFIIFHIFSLSISFSLQSFVAFFQLLCISISQSSFITFFKCTLYTLYMRNGKYTHEETKFLFAVSSSYDANGEMRKYQLCCVTQPWVLCRFINLHGDVTSKIKS